MTEEQDIFGRSQLHYAAVENDAEKARSAIEAGADLDLEDRFGHTPLHMAAQSQAGDVVEILLKAGAFIDAQTPNGHTPLFFAVVRSNGNGHIIRLLRDAGADPFLRSSSGMSPIYVARHITETNAADFFADLPKSDTDDT